MNNSTKQINIYLMVRILILNFIIGFLYFFIASEGISKNVFLYVLIVTNMIFIFLSIFRNIAGYGNKVLLFHFAADVLIVTFLTYFDSGIFKSDLTLLYYLIIISAGLFFNDRGSIIIATLVSLFYVTSIILIFNDVIPVHDVSGGIVVFGGEYQMAYLRLFINLVMFYVTSFVISNLKIAYRQKGEEFEVQKILLDDIFENIRDYILVFDKNGYLSNWNKKAYELRGGTIREGAHYETALPHEMAICLDKMKQHGLSTYSNEFVTGNGTYTYEINLMKKDDAPIGYMVTITDITKKKELETRVMEMDKLAYMGTLGAGMAHELRNPLASLYGSIELLNEKSFNDKDKKLYSLILKESERLNKIVSDFLDFVKGENIEQTFIDLRQVVSETLTMINILTEKKIVTDIKINTIYGDSNLLIQTLNNLIWNALEAVDEDGTVTIRALRKGKNDIIEVSDNGSGIPKEELENIYTPFYSMKKSGAGLGLAIVKKNVITMGGKVEVESEINKGTTFRVVLPSNNERD